MNPHLQLLLSPVYDGALAPEHRADLEKSGLSAATIREQFIRSVPPAMIGPLLGFDLPAIRSALLFPFLAPAGGFMDHVRMKVFPTLMDGEGHATKYLQPRGTSPRLYFVRSAMRAVLAPRGSLIISEGEKKACALAQAGHAAVGIAGVEGWHCRRSHTLLDDFAAIPLIGREVTVLPDGDYATNRQVARAVEALVDALYAARAALVNVAVPKEAPGAEEEIRLED